MEVADIRREMEYAFRQDLLDGTVEIYESERSAVLNGGNWSLAIQHDGTVTITLPEDDTDYFSNDPDIFLDNVLNIEVEQSLGILNRSLHGAVLRGLSSSTAPWAQLIESRIASAPTE